jgi:hypothetical protein
MTDFKLWTSSHPRAARADLVGISDKLEPRSGAAAVATVEQFLIRGLGTACQVCVAGLPQPDSRRSALPLPKLPEDPPDRHQRPEAIGLVRNPDGREFSGTRKPRQHECITPIGLDVISGAFGSETTKILLRMKY